MALITSHQESPPGTSSFSEDPTLTPVLYFTLVGRRMDRILDDEPANHAAATATAAASSETSSSSVAAISSSSVAALSSSSLAAISTNSTRANSTLPISTSSLQVPPHAATLAASPHPPGRALPTVATAPTASASPSLSFPIGNRATRNGAVTPTHALASSSSTASVTRLPPPPITTSGDGSGATSKKQGKHSKRAASSKSKSNTIALPFTKKKRTSPKLTQLQSNLFDRIHITSEKPFKKREFKCSIKSEIPPDHLLEGATRECAVVDRVELGGLAWENGLREGDWFILNDSIDQPELASYSHVIKQIEGDSALDLYTLRLKQNLTKQSLADVVDACCSSSDGNCCSQPPNHFAKVFGKYFLLNSTNVTSATTTTTTTTAATATTTTTSSPMTDPSPAFVSVAVSAVVPAADPSPATTTVPTPATAETPASQESYYSDNHEKRLFGGVKPELNQQAVDLLQKLTVLALWTGTSSLDIGHQGFVQRFKVIQENLYGLADLLKIPRVRVQDLDVPTALARFMHFMCHQPFGNEICTNECIELVKEKLLEHFLEDIPIGKEDEISQFSTVVDYVPGFLLEKTTAYDDTKDLMSALGQKNWECFVAALLTAYSRMIQCNRKEAGDEHAEEPTPAMVMGGDSSPQMKFVSSWCLELKEKGCDFTFEYQGHLHIRCAFHPQALYEHYRHRYALLKPWLVAMWDIGLTSMLRKGAPSLRDRCSFDLKWKECSTFFWGLVRRREIMGDHSDPAKAKAAWCRFLDKQQPKFKFSLELLKLSCPLEAMRKFIDDQGVDKLYGFKPVTASSQHAVSLGGLLPAGLGGLPLEDLRGRPELIGLVFDLPTTNVSTQASSADALTPPPAPSSDPECCEEGCRLWKSGNGEGCRCHGYDCGTCQHDGDDGKPCHRLAIGPHGCCMPHYYGPCQHDGDDGKPCHRPAIGTHGCCGPHYHGPCQHDGDDGNPCHRPAIGTHGCCGPHCHGPCQHDGDDGNPCHRLAIGPHGCCRPHFLGPCKNVVGGKACDGEAMCRDGLCQQCHVGFTGPVKRQPKTKCNGKNGQGCPWNRNAKKLCKMCQYGPCPGLNNEKCPHDAPSSTKAQKLCTKCTVGNITCKGADGMGCPKSLLAVTKKNGLCNSCRKGWCKGINGNPCPKNNVSYYKELALCMACYKRKNEEQASSK